ncbi:Hypothetical_protein [Hexamita inflata]|uniref:Hypothetical_protein n=1 Tax=Hexamita inflata TaxID=28002 RepID=A0AA86RJF7_9EUKA|nr:Hypothetical protein HINF_LOCUS65382 [Hexamita inflata]
MKYGRGFERNNNSFGNNCEPGCVSKECFLQYGTQLCSRNGEQVVFMQSFVRKAVFRVPRQSVLNQTANAAGQNSVICFAYSPVPVQHFKHGGQMQFKSANANTQGLVSRTQHDCITRWAEPADRVQVKIGQTPYQLRL